MLQTRICKQYRIFQNKSIVSISSISGHWVVESNWENKVVLRNNLYPHYYASMRNDGLVVSAAVSLFFSFREIK